MTQKLIDQIHDLPGGAPWCAYRDNERNSTWTSGDVRHVNNITESVQLPPIEEVAEIMLTASDGGHWDGTQVALFRLRSGQFMTWETWWGPTGDGFNMDAYGGDADVWIANSLGDALRLGLTDEGRRMLFDQVTAETE